METLSYKSCYSDEVYELAFEVACYAANNNVSVTGYCKSEDGDFWEPFCDLTVNVDKLPDGCACIHTNHWADAEEFIQKNDLGKPTGMYLHSGFCDFPVYSLNLDKIRRYQLTEEETEF